MSLRKRLLEDELIISTMISEVGNPNLSRMLATAGLDSMIIDMEHGAFGWPDMAAMIGVARGADLAPIVRIPEIRRESVLKPLDAGASGLLIPMVNSAEQAREVVRLAKYPPVGLRGTALRRGHSDYQIVPAEEYLRDANENLAILVQIETTEAVRNLQEILRVDGIDAVFIGPFDLSVDMGIPGRVWDPKIRKVYSAVISTARRNGVAAAIHLLDVEQARKLISEGIRYISISSDVNMIIDHASASAASLREVVV